MEQDYPSIAHSEPSFAARSAPQMFQNAHHFDLQTAQLNNVHGVNIHQAFPCPIAVPSPPIARSQQMGPSTPSHQAPVYSESRNYSNQLLRQGRGFPLYVPGPHRNLPLEYKREGVAIGDVGTVTPEGIFDFLFNIYLSANHPINSNVPEDFVPLPPYDLVDVIHDDFDPGDYVSPPSIHEINGDFSEHAPGGEFIFNCRGPNGAILALPHGSHLQKLRNLETVQRYAGKHAESWYKYANETRGRGLVNGSLYLVTGCEKARSWGMASFREVSLEELQLSFRPTTDADNGYRYRWRGSHCRHKHADSPSVDGAPLNQTTFIHAFAISLSEGIWGMRFGDVKICQLTDSPFLDKSVRSFIPYGSQGSSFAWSLFFGGTTGGGKQCTGQAPGNGIISNASPIPQVFHPSQIIHERILREAPEAKVVITHDDDWSDIFRNDGMQTTGKSSSDLQEAIFDRFEIIIADGTAFLKSKSDPTRSSANPVTKPPSEAGSIPVLTPSLSSSSILKDGAAENVADEQPIDGDRSTLDQSQENRDKANASQTYLDSTTIDVTLPSPETSPLRSRYIQPHPPKRRASIRTNTAERRATHNALERMRRETLNGRFLTLASLLPPPTGPYDPPRRRHQRSSLESKGGGSSTLDTPSSPFPPSPGLSPTNSIPSPSIEPFPTSAIPSPTHSAHDPRSPILPWYTGPFLDLPQMHGQPLRGSETLSNRSSTPNLDWSVNASHMSNSLYEQFILDNSLHPPMMPGAGDFLAPDHSMMYRHSNASFWGSSDASSVQSPSPNTEWDPASPLGGSHLDAPLPDAQDEDSPKTSSSNETERAAGHQNEDLQGLTQRLQLHGRAGPTAGPYSQSGHFASHPSGTSVDIGPPHQMSSTQHPHRSTNAGSGLIDAGLSSKEQILPSGGEHSQEGRLFRPVVSTVAGRRAATARRKDKTKPGLHVCELCGAEFTAKHNLRNHMNSHNSLKEFFCRMCRRGFGTKHVMQRHERKCNRRA